MLVGIIVTYHIFCIYFSTYKSIIKTREIFGEERDQLYKINSGYTVPDYHYYENYRDFLIELKDTYSVSIYESTSLSFEGNKRSELLNYLEQNSGFTNIQQSSSSIPVLKMDNDLLHIIDIRTENNEVLQLGMKGERFEVAVGSSYKNVLQIGDTFEDKLTGKKYIITSFLDENQEWISSGVYNSEIIPLDLYFITSIDLKEYTDFSCMVYTDNIYVFLESDEANAKIKEIENLAKNNDIYIDIVSFKENEVSHIIENKNLYNLSFLLSIIMFVTVFVVIGIMAILSWMFDYHDIGILYANGFTNSDIRNIILHENLLKMVFPLLFSYGYLLSSVSDAGSDKSYSLLIYGIIIIIYMVEMVLCSYLSYRFIRKYAPIRLLGGEGI